MKNNWYVITGAPCSGKTTIVQLLEKAGHKVIYEAARVYIDQEIKKGRSLKEIRKDELSFQRKVLESKTRVEKKLSPKEIVFLDRAIPDTIAYYELLGIPVDKKLEDIVKRSQYKKVFFFKKLDYEIDYARTETDEEVKKLEKLLLNTYKKLNLSIIKVPVMKIEDRLNFILNNL